MAKDKKSFLIYCDIIHTIQHLTDEEKGKLFQHLLEYVNDLNPVLEDRLLLIAWKPIELQLKRDLVKYESICDRNSKNGSLGGRPKKPKKPNGLFGNPDKPKKADTDTDTDTDTDNESINTFTHESFLIWFKQCRNYLGLKFNVKKLSTLEKQLFNELKEYTKEDFKIAFKNFSNDKYWNDPTKSLLMPKHFLNYEHFTKYLNAEVKTELTLGQKLMGRVQ
tara:strand:+ start:2204 stop:2866 length:663 start_codon:yes stop_codon:yes gene_type:complete